MATISQPADAALFALLSELRTAMTPVVGYLELLASEGPGGAGPDLGRQLDRVEVRLSEVEELARELRTRVHGIRAQAAPARNAASGRPAAGTPPPSA